MNKTIRTKLIAMLLAAVMAVGLAACGSQSAGSPGAGAPGIADTGELPEVNALPGIPRGDKNKNKLDPETTLKQYGEIETLVKSVKSPTKPDTKNTKMDNGYGTVDWSTAANGYNQAAQSPKVFWQAISSIPRASAQRRAISGVT